MRDNLIKIGIIKGPNGLGGKMWLTPYGDSFETFKTYSHLIIDEKLPEFKITSSVLKNGRYIISLEGIDHISKAEELKGKAVYIKREWLPKTDNDEFYWCDLIGMQVQDLSGRIVGSIVNIFRTGSNDVYVVDEIKQYYIPSLKNIIIKIDQINGIMTIDSAPLSGIIDL